MIIDFHTHVFPDRVAPAALSALSADAGIAPHTDGTADGLAASMAQADITLSVNLPVLTRSDQGTRVNTRLLREREALQQKGILCFGGVHPDDANVCSVLRELRREGVPGIKLHPAYQHTDLDDDRFLRIIDHASELGMIVLTHAGLDIGIPGHNFADIGHILNVIDRAHPPRFILAHMGGWADWDNVLHYLAGAPVWLDTAFSLKTPKAPACHMEADAFTKLCRAHGTDRILFATDSPWSEQRAYVEAIRNMDFTEQEREAILYRNAASLLCL